MYACMFIGMCLDIFLLEYTQHPYKLILLHSWLYMYVTLDALSCLDACTICVESFEWESFVDYWVKEYLEYKSCSESFPNTLHVLYIDSFGGNGL